MYLFARRTASHSIYPSPPIVPISLVPTLTHPAPSLVVPHPYTYTPHPLRALSAPIAVCANSHSAGPQLPMHVESRAPHRRSCSRTRTRTSTALLGIAVPHRARSPLPTRPAPHLLSTISFLISTPCLPALAPPHIFCPDLRSARRAECALSASMESPRPRASGSCQCAS
ncbi:hypothetical protein C8F04DRAFT_1269968 [Mycena alexandri]|uniref:Uncharacterized protein n=1 Tax=Mycena alexandri TaxID=1745969 RepID=A0AAD6WRS2_9AGAR|nr:hypothetical protein C8F04DRAFT_1269968 [Mycena alexandri]